MSLNAPPGRFLALRTKPKKLQFHYWNKVTLTLAVMDYLYLTTIKSIQINQLAPVAMVTIVEPTWLWKSGSQWLLISVGKTICCNRGGGRHTNTLTLHWSCLRFPAALRTVNDAQGYYNWRTCSVRDIGWQQRSEGYVCVLNQKSRGKENENEKNRLVHSNVGEKLGHSHWSKSST